MKLNLLLLQVVEKLVASGSLGIEDFASALEKRHKHQSTQLKLQQQDLSVVLALGKVLSISTESKVIDFLRMLYVKLFQVYDDHKHRLRQVYPLYTRNGFPFIICWNPAGLHLLWFYNVELTIRLSISMIYSTQVPDRGVF